MSLENYKEIHDYGNPDECGSIETPCPWCKIAELEKDRDEWKAAAKLWMDDCRKAWADE
jgi:hypothetical protein